MSGENERYWNERSVATRAKRVWIVSKFQYRFRHKLQTVLFIIHALAWFLIQVSEKQHFRYDLCHGFDKWAFRHKKQMQYNICFRSMYYKNFIFSSHSPD